jgi:hypothetical protein
MVETCLASMGRSSHQRSLTLSSEPPSSPFSHRLNPLDRSAIFLPPEVAFSVSVHSSTNGYTSSRRRLGVLIGNTTVYGDEIPIHELDTIFEAEGARYLATDSNDDRQSDTSSVLTSPSILRVGSIGKLPARGVKRRVERHRDHPRLQHAHRRLRGKPESLCQHRDSR